MAERRPDHAEASLSAAVYDFPAAAGKMSEKIRAYDWTQTSLGASASWPVSLRSVVEMMLASEFAKCMFWSEEWICIYNDAYAPILGDKPEALGRPLRDIWPEIFDDIRPIAEAAMGGKSTYLEDMRLIVDRGGGREDAFFTFCYSPLRDDRGGVGGFIDTVIETTAKIKAEAAAKEANERFLRLFEQSPAFMAYLRGPSHVIEYTNPNYLKLIGHRDVTGRTVAEALEDAAAQGYVDLLDQVYASGQPYAANSALYAVQAGPDGPVNDRYVDFVFQPVVEGNGEVSGILVQGVDVTEREIAERGHKQATADTAEAREHLSLMLNSAIEYAIMSMNVDGEITIWNPGAERIFGHNADEVVGKHFRLIFTDEDQAVRAPESELERVTRDGRSSDERWHVRKNGERFYASGVVAAMQDDQGQVRGFMKIASDKSDEKRAQEELVAARNAAEAANIAKSEFLANMSHEIRTPMNAVMGLSSILAMSRPLTPRQQEYLRTLQMSADSLLALINDLLDIAKIEASSVELEHIPFSVTQIVQEVSSMLAVRVKEKGLTFTMEGECVEHRHFIGDPTRLRQIILNLCSNAVKFTSAGGVHVAITCHATEQPEVETICVSVEDTGIGIAPDVVSTIFQKFVQADSSISRKYGGTGLGLAITKTLAEIMGGTITVKSEIGVGSKFKVCMPMQLAADQAVAEADYSLASSMDAQRDARFTGTVLLVEDYEPNVLVATTFLETFGMEVEVARDGAEAVRAVAGRIFDLVIMDVQMPEMNGFEATRRIRQLEVQKGTGPTYIIGMTAHVMAGDEERCIAAGMNDYISKPFNPEQLRLKLTSVLNPA